MAVPPAPLISNTTPLSANTPWTSTVQQIARATQITGSVYADVAGTLVVQQSGDGTNWDVKNTYNVPAATAVTIELDAIQPYLQVTYTNGSTTQTTFRLYLNIRDVYGTFLAGSLAPSDGAPYVVLFEHTPGTYVVVGRFDGLDPEQANAAAAVYQNKSGQYAAFNVTDATVTVETLAEATTYTVGAF